MSLTPEQQLAGFIDKFTPEMAALIRQTRSKMRALMPTAQELVYDNYNFFVIGYGPNDKAGQAIFSLAAQAKGLSLVFLQGKALPDPTKILKGSGNVVRSIRLDSAATLHRPEVRALIREALQGGKTPLDANGKHSLIIKSVSAKQRPRRSPQTLRKSTSAR